MSSHRLICTILVCAASSLLFPSPVQGQTTFTVNTVADDGDFDTGDGVCDTDDNAGDGPCTLRAAIEQANATPNADASTPDRIEFNISGSGPHVIEPNSFASAVNEAVIIDGTTEPDYSGTPVVVLDGGPNDRDIGMTLAGAGSVVRALSVVGFNNIGMSLAGSGSHTVAGCYVGVRPDGTTPGNPGAGIFINGDSVDNLIGGSDAADRNIISGNGEEGVAAAGRTFPMQIVDGTVVRNNWIGVAPDGSSAAGNGTDGVSIGGPAESIRILDNVIADNGERGIDAGTLTDVVIQGNRIGTTVDGTGALGNGRDGMECQDCAELQIGGTASGDRNLISDNGWSGIALIGEDPSVPGLVVEGNWIGVDAAGTADFGNGVGGITLRGGFDAPRIGGASAAERNVIAGSGTVGIEIDQYTPNSEPVDDPADRVHIENNYIGVDATGMLDRGGGDDGIRILGGTDHKILDNVISGSTDSGGGSSDGIEIQTYDPVTIQGNLIGTRADGTGVFGNTGSGIHCVASTNVTIGGTGPGEGNRIVGSGWDGISLGFNSGPVKGNIIGRTADGVAGGSGRDGIYVGSSARDFTIGGTTSAARNTIAHSGRNGITVEYDEVIGSLQWADSISIRQNTIIQSERVGIDLDTTPGEDINDHPLTDGETLNDALDDDTDLPNELQNFPEFSRFVYDAGTNTVTVDVDVPTATANAVYPLTVEFFRTGPYGQTEAYLGSTMIQSGDAQAEQTVTFTPQASLARQDFVVATATAADGRTSEINPLRQVVTMSGSTPANYSYDYLELRVNAQAVGTGSGTARVPIRNELRDPANGIPSGTALAIAGSWLVDVAGGPALFEICLPLDNLINPPADVNLSALTVYGREDATTAWQSLPTSLQPGSSSPTYVCGDVSSSGVLSTDGGEFIVAAAPSELPVELSTFEAHLIEERVQVAWTTVGETDNARFDVQRRVVRNDVTAGETWTTIGRRTGAGTTNQTQTYQFRDTDLPFAAQTLEYRLKQVDTDGSQHVSAPVTVERGRVERLRLRKTVPNPAQDHVTVRYAVPDTRAAPDVNIAMYDMLGRRVRRVTAGPKRGRHEVQVSLGGLASGLYLLRLEAGGVVRTRRLTVVQ